MPISVTFGMDIDLSKTKFSQKNRSGLKKSNSGKANILHYISALTALLSTIRVPYHLFQCQVPTNGKGNTDYFYNQLLMCRKKAEEATVPRKRSRKRAQKLI